MSKSGTCSLSLSCDMEAHIDYSLLVYAFGQQQYMRLNSNNMFAWSSVSI